jgi:hypothetical protein
METRIEEAVCAWRALCFVSNADRYLIVFSFGVLGEYHFICYCYSVSNFALRMYFTPGLFLQLVICQMALRPVIMKQSRSTYASVGIASPYLSVASVRLHLKNF